MGRKGVEWQYLPSENTCSQPSCVFSKRQKQPHAVALKHGTGQGSSLAHHANLLMPISDPTGSVINLHGLIGSAKGHLLYESKPGHLQYIWY